MSTPTAPGEVGAPPAVTAKAVEPAAGWRSTPMKLLPVGSGVDRPQRSAPCGSRLQRAARHEAGGDGDIERIAALYTSIGTPSACAAAREDVLLLEQALDQLAPEDRQVIALCRIGGLPRDEAGRILGKSTGAVRVHLSRALVRLGSELERLGVVGEG